MRLILKYIVFFTCVSSLAQTITSPQIGCVSVISNDSISITWQVPPDPGGQFKNYVIYISTSPAGTYTQQTPYINTYATNTAIITGVNTNANLYYIYVQTTATSGLTQPATATVNTMFLSVTPSATSPGIAHLTWNSISPPLSYGEASSYSIYKNYYHDGGGWQFVASVPFNGTTHYNYYDTITVCNDSINYKIELTDTLLHCTSVSNIAGKHLQNKNNPTQPIIDSVSVLNYETATPETIIGISSAYSHDVMCFKIYNYDSGNTYVLLDSICNYNVDTSYIYSTGSLPSAGSVTITAISKDSCGNKSSFPLQQSTIYTNISYDQCKKTMDINWTPYQNMVTGVHDYQIFCSTNNSPFVCIGDTNATVYYHRHLLPGTTYCYFVRAHSNGKTKAGKDTASSTSNQSCKTTNSPPISQFAYLSNVTVNAQQTINVLWDVDNTHPIGGYDLYRATSKTGPYSLISYIPSTNNYTDGNVNTNSQEYFYYVQVLDTCLNPTISTMDTSNSIVLTAVPSANLTATLNWNSYAKYLGGVSGYTIYRSVNNAGFTAVNTVTVTTYVDDLSPFAVDEGVFLYYVEAMEGPGNPYGLAEISQSNTDTVYMDANLYIPNCFTPNGKNKVFLPIGAYIDNTNYTLDIFDRYGVKIFESTDPNTGWNGGGHEEGVYAYTVKYQTSIGEFRQRHGTVTLLK